MALPQSVTSGEADIIMLVYPLRLSLGTLTNVIDCNAASIIAMASIPHYSLPFGSRSAGSSSHALNVRHCCQWTSLVVDGVYPSIPPYHTAKAVTD